MSEWSLKEQVGIKQMKKLTKSTPEYTVNNRYEMGVHDLFVELQAVYYDCLGQCLAYTVSTT